MSEDRWERTPYRLENLVCAILAAHSLEHHVTSALGAGKLGGESDYIIQNFSRGVIIRALAIEDELCRVEEQRMHALASTREENTKALAQLRERVTNKFHFSNRSDFIEALAFALGKYEDNGATYHEDAASIAAIIEEARK